MAMINAGLGTIIKSKGVAKTQKDTGKSPQSLMHENQSKIIVSNLDPKDVNVQELTDMFNDFGRVLSLKVAKDESNAKKSIVKIKYDEDADAGQAVECWNNVYLGKSVMKVACSTEDEDRRSVASEIQSPRRARRKPRRKMTKEDLDRELDEYMTARRR